MESHVIPTLSEQLWQGIIIEIFLLISAPLQFGHIPVEKKFIYSKPAFFLWLYMLIYQHVDKAFRKLKNENIWGIFLQD